MLQASSSSDDSDSDGPVSPLRPVRPRRSFPAAPSQTDVPPAKEAAAVPGSGRDGNRETPASVFGREEYHSAIRGLGSAKSLLQGLSQPQFSSTPAFSSGSRSALVPEDDYVADDWLEDDLGEMQPKKKRRLRRDSREDEAIESLAARSQNKQLNSDTAPRGIYSGFVSVFFFFQPTFLYFSHLL